MASCISYKEQYFWVNNSRFSTLIDFALEKGAQMAATADEVEFVVQLRRGAQEHFNVGYSLDLDEWFPLLPKKQFWARVFLEVGQSIFRRELGNQEDSSWQASAICDAHLICRMLTHAVREVESGWSPWVGRPDSNNLPEGGGINIAL